MPLALPKGHDYPGSVRAAIRRRLYLPTSRFRKRRMVDFLREFPLRPGMRVLDLGGTDLNWRLIDQPAEVVLLNIVVPETTRDLPPNLSYEVGDATQRHYEENEFDVCFSNSTIEHLGTYESQKAFANEVRRVGRGLWVQTPARGFPFEPHWLGLFIHWLPARWQRRLARNFTLWGWVNRPTQQQVDELVSEYRLLSHREMRELFPDCEIRREHFLGLTKSFVAVRHLEDPQLAGIRPAEAVHRRQPAVRR